MHKRILIVAITRLGDLLQASPTILGLKAENPDAHITVLVDKGFAKICEGIPGIDELYVIDLAMMVRSIHHEKVGMVDAYRYLDEIVGDLREKDFDYCLNMASSGYTALLLRLLNIKESRGWIADHEGMRLISNPWTMLFAAYVYHANRAYNSLNLVDIVRCSAGVTKHPKSLRYNVREEETASVEELLKAKGLDGEGPLIALQAGASQEKRQWATQKFATLCRLLVEDLNARVVLTGTKEELPIIEDIIRHYSHPRVQSVLGETNLDQLAVLLKKAELLITGDTGPMHLSIAVGTPVVAIFLASAHCHETGPYSEGNFVIQSRIGCQPCNPNFPCARPDCHDQITPELIAFMAKLRLEVPMGEEAGVQVPQSLANPLDVGVYYSAFDQDAFLEFREMNGITQSEGIVGRHREAAKQAYRRLWKEEFGAVPTAPLGEESGPSSGQAMLSVFGSEESSPAEGLKSIVQCTGEGMKTIDELVEIVRDVRGSAEDLGQKNRRLIEIDRDIRNLGLNYPSLGALVRYFVMEKENMRGEDPIELASQMRGLYEQLSRRSEKFGRLYASNLKAKH